MGRHDPSPLPSTPHGVEQKGRSLTPQTTIKMTARQMIALIAALVVAVVAVMGAYWQGKAHADNDRVHLETKFREVHGAPVGKWDLQQAINMQTDRINNLTTVVNSALQELKDGHDRLGIDPSKCRRKGNNIICPVSR